VFSFFPFCPDDNDKEGLFSKLRSNSRQFVHSCLLKKARGLMIKALHLLFEQIEYSLFIFTLILPYFSTDNGEHQSNNISHLSL